MKLKKHICLLMALLVLITFSCSNDDSPEHITDCFSSSVTLKTQAEVDAFVQKEEYCATIKDLIIGDLDGGLSDI